MDKTDLSLQRLECILQHFEGQESLGTDTKFADFLKHYFTRFISGLKYSVSDFSESEIEKFDKVYGRKTNQSIGDPLLDIDKEFVPIPKGMLYGYLKTIDALKKILISISADKLLDDTKNVLESLKTHDLSHLTGIHYSKRQFDHDRTSIGELFSKIGLIQSIPKRVLIDKVSIKLSTEMLLDITKTYYHTAIDLPPLFTKIEKYHGDANLETEEKTIVSDKLMSLAYRLSIFGVVMDHIQDIEHNFVKCLEIIKSKSLRA